MKFEYVIRDKAVMKALTRASQSSYGKKLIQQTLENIGDGIIERSKRLVPVGLTSALFNSADMKKLGSTGIRVGYFAKYAAVQDWPEEFGPGPRVIRPKNAFALYVPLTERGRRAYSPGGTRKDPTLIYGVDYYFAQETQVPVKPYGSNIGPNKYFSGTWRSMLPEITSELGWLAADILVTAGIPAKRVRRSAKARASGRGFGRARFGRAKYRHGGAKTRSHGG